MEFVFEKDGVSVRKGVKLMLEAIFFAATFSFASFLSVEKSIDWARLVFILLENFLTFYNFQNSV